jgi:hypothetical protein
VCVCVCVFVLFVLATHARVPHGPAEMRCVVYATAHQTGGQRGAPQTDLLDCGGAGKCSTINVSVQQQASRSAGENPPTHP